MLAGSGVGDKCARGGGGAERGGAVGFRRADGPANVAEAVGCLQFPRPSGHRGGDCDRRFLAGLPGLATPSTDDSSHGRLP